MTPVKIHTGNSELTSYKNTFETFPTNLAQILERVANIDPPKYALTRNFINGGVTYLSPYISRGVISLPLIKETILQKHTVHESEKLIQQLAWREYFQRVWQSRGDDLGTDIKQVQTNVAHQEIPTALVDANTGITEIDTAIAQLYQFGYMHNHARMYTAMLATNIAKAHWLAPANWLYYHLLDGDVASNRLSWQWVAGSFSSKKYIANQDNINKFTGTSQKNTFLDTDYEVLSNIPIPITLLACTDIKLTTQLPQTNLPTLDANLPLYIYNSYQLDPFWHQNEKGNRVLLLEPSHFEKYPISEKVLQFIFELAKNIPDMHVYTGEFKALLALYPNTSQLFFKEHPTTLHYIGNRENRDWLFPEITGYYPSFFAYWKKCVKYL